MKKTKRCPDCGVAHIAISRESCLACAGKKKTPSAGTATPVEESVVPAPKALPPNVGSFLARHTTPTGKIVFTATGTEVPVDVSQTPSD